MGMGINQTANNIEENISQSEKYSDQPVMLAWNMK